MASQTGGIMIVPSSTSPKDATLHLMPFNIGYTGPAPSSLYWNVRDASTTSPGEAQVAEGDTQESSTSTLVDTPLGNILKDKAKSLQKRFIAAFRGRRMHGMEIELPAGYTGVVLTGKQDKEDEVEASEDTKTGGKRKRGAAKNDGAPAKKLKQTVKTVVSGVTGKPEEDGRPPAKELTPAATFSSFVAWAPDRKFDENEDQNYPNTQPHIFNRRWKMRQSSVRRHHEKKAFGFIPNGNNNDTGDSPDTGANANAGGSSSAAASTTVARTTSAAPSRSVISTTTTPPAPAAQPTTTTTTTTPPASSSSVVTSSSALATSSTTSIVVVTPTTISVNQIPTTASIPITRSIASASIVTASLSSASASATAAASDSGPSIGPLVGAIGGGLIGVVALAAVAGYFFRRAFRKKDDFDKSEFVRNSVAIHDDWNEKPPMGTQNALALARANNQADEPSANPRPPSMFERRGQAQPSYGVGEVMNDGYYGQQDQYYNYGNNGYYGHDQYAAGYDQQHQQYPAGDQGYAAGYGYTPPNEYQQSQLTRKPSAPMGAARGPGSEYQQQAHDNVAPPADSNYPQYDSRHQSVTPYQQQQYNEINAALQAPAPAAGGRELPTSYSTLNQPQQGAHPQQQGHLAAPGANNRRSVYDDDDAYGGM
ncbi:hypothetical protein FRB90_006419 [Tulasnella sp. 427]|nr:hypothetical protein FRB90_006419 [Tulasnella sp. 427]